MNSPTPAATPAMLTKRQRELFDALLTDFLAEGFDSFTIDGAAARYRCSKSTIYALGKSRDQVVRRVLVTFFREVTRRTQSQIGGLRSYRSALETYFAAMATALEPASTAFMRDLVNDSVGQGVYTTNTEAANRVITELIQKGIQAGEFQVDNPTFVSTVISAAMQQIQQGVHAENISAPEAYRELGRLVIYGINRR